MRELQIADDDLISAVKEGIVELFDIPVDKQYLFTDFEGEDRELKDDFTVKHYEIKKDQVL